jgi:beta-phosphoglucomutase-like phosphatase (HAD superfamily)
MNKELVSLIALDMVGVLVTETNIVSRHLFEMLPDPKRIEREVLKRRYDEGLSVGKLSVAEFWTGVVNGRWESFELGFLRSLSFDTEAKGCLTRLLKRYELAVITDLPARWGNIILEQNGVFQFFKWFIFGDSSEGNKKDGGAYRRLAWECRVDPEEILVIDDGVANLDAASAVGMQVLGYGKPKEGSKYNWVASFMELSRLVLRGSEF